MYIFSMTAVGTEICGVDISKMKPGQYLCSVCEKLAAAPPTVSGVPVPDLGSEQP